MRFEIRTALSSLVIAASDMAASHDQIAALREASPDTFAIDMVAADGTRKAIVSPAPAATPAPLPVVAPEPPAPAPISTFDAPIIDASAKDRIDAQHTALRATGLDKIGHAKTGGNGEQFYANGTRMAESGYAHHAARKLEHDALLPIVDAAHGLASAVRGEGRADVILSAAEFGKAISVNGKITVHGHALSERAIRGLLARIDSPALGYVLGLRERIATEVSKGEAKDKARIVADTARIAETLAFECARAGDLALKLRTRKAPHDVFAVVSPAYVAADAPESMDELLPHLPGDTRGTWAYDPKTTAWNFRVHCWTPTPVEQQAVGEAFEGYADFTGRDNGTGRWSGGGGVNFIRCLNASTYTAESARVARVHRGKVLSDVAMVVKSATQSISALCQLWGRNREIEVSAPGPIPMEEAIPGFWRWLLQDRSSELLGVLRGKTEEHAQGLASAYHAERRDQDRVTRADLGQGWTKYVQRFDRDVRTEAESAIGSWLANVRPVGFTAARAA